MTFSHYCTPEFLNFRRALWAFCFDQRIFLQRWSNFLGLQRPVKSLVCQRKSSTSILEQMEREIMVYADIRWFVCTRGPPVTRFQQVLFLLLLQYKVEFEGNLSLVKYVWRATEKSGLSKKNHPPQSMRKWNIKSWLPGHQIFLYKRSFSNTVSASVIFSFCSIQGEFTFSSGKAGERSVKSLVCQSSFTVINWVIETWKYG